MKLTPEFSGMDLHVGKYFQVRAVDKASMEEVGRKTIASIPRASFSVDLFVLIDGHSYHIDFHKDPGCAKNRPSW